MIKKIVAANFLSWKVLEFDINSGITLIDGWNYDDETSEGSGKSAILNALSWGLYGKLPKDTKIDDVISHGQKTCLVALEFEDFTIVRSRNPNKLTVNGKQEKDTKKTQQLINRIVGLSFETFCQSIYFPQNYAKKFLTSTQEEKSKILSEIQELELFDDARKEMLKKDKELSENLYTLKLELSKNETKIIEADSKIKLNIKELEKIDLEKESQLELLNLQINNYNENVNELKKEKESLFIQKYEVQTNLECFNEKDILEHIEKFKTEINVLRVEEQLLNDVKRLNQKKEIEKQQLNLQRDKIIEEIKQIGKQLKDPTHRCHVCNSELGELDVDSIKKNLILKDQEFEENRLKIAKIKEQPEIDLEVIKSQILTVKSQLDEYSSHLNTINSHKQHIKYIDQESLKIEDKIKKLKETNVKNLMKKEEKLTNFKDFEKEQIQKEIDSLKETIKKLTKNLHNLNTSIKDIEAELHKIGLLKNGFKEIKSVIFNNVLNQLQTKTNQYLSPLFEVPINVIFKNEKMKITTEIYINNQKFSLGLLSGGQFRRVNLAVDLALSDIVTQRSSTQFNLLIIDEYFKDLSEESMYKCLNLLESLNKSILIIEHNSIFKSAINNIKKIELRNGISTLKES